MRVTLPMVLLCLIPLFAGCASPSPLATVSTPPPVTTPPAVTQPGVYLIDVLSQNSSSVLTYPLALNASSASSTLYRETGAVLSSIAVDGAGNFYCLEQSPTTLALDILEFQVSSSGVFTAVRRITQSPSAEFGAPGLAVDQAGDVAVIGNSGTPSQSAILIFSSTATGAATPARVIGGSATSLSLTFNLAFVASGYLYAEEYDATLFNRILVFGPTASGNVAPSRTLIPPQELLLGGMTFDKAGNLYVAETYYTTQPISGAIVTEAPSVVEYAASANGAASPVMTIAPPDSSYFYLDVKMDSTGALYLLGGDLNNNGYVFKFAAGATGAALPTSTTPLTGTGALDSSIAVVGP